MICWFWWDQWKGNYIYLLLWIRQQIFGHSGAPSLLTIGKELLFICGWLQPTNHISSTHGMWNPYSSNSGSFSLWISCRIYPTWLIWVNHKSLMVMWQLLDALLWTIPGFHSSVHPGIWDGDHIPAEQHHKPAALGKNKACRNKTWQSDFSTSR